MIETHLSEMTKGNDATYCWIVVGFVALNILLPETKCERSSAYRPGHPMRPEHPAIVLTSDNTSYRVP